MLQYFQTVDGNWHWPSIWPTLAWFFGALAAGFFVVGRLYTDYRDRIDADRRITIQKAEGEIRLEFEHPIIWKAEPHRPPFLYVQRGYAINETPTNPAYLKMEYAVPLQQEGTLTKTVIIRITGNQAFSTDNRLDTVSAKMLAQDFDYLVAVATPFDIPNDVSYSGTVSLTVNNRIEYTFVIPRHNPSKWPMVRIPLNEKAKLALADYAIFSPTQKGLLHYHDMDNPTQTKIE